jgi:hypothetical protein
MNRTLALAKHDFETGALRHFSIARVPLSSYWCVQLGGAPLGFLVDARSKERRLFKTVDAAVAAVEQIGFKVFDLHAV